MLNESDFLLCERVDNCKKRIKEIEDVSDIAQMIAIIENMISRVKKLSANIESYNYDGIEMFDLLSWLKHLNERNVNFKDCLLPAEDIQSNEAPCRVWELYSEKQMANRLSKFFYFHQISFTEMIEMNFPVLRNRFARYLDAPYQNVIVVGNRNQSISPDRGSEPSLLYYYIASKKNCPMSPQLVFLDEEIDTKEVSKDIDRKIRQSYFEQGKTAHYLGWTSTGLSFAISSRRSGANNPLSEFVYKSIKESLESILGRL